MSEISRTAPVTAAQVRSIHVALARQGIDDGTYRLLLLRGWGVASCKQLTRRQASDLLARLGRPLPRAPGEQPPRPPRPKRPRGPRSAVGVVRLASPAQRDFIAALVAEIAWRQPDGYAGWLRRNQGLERVATAGQATRVIQGLRALKRRSPADG